MNINTNNNTNNKLYIKYGLNFYTCFAFLCSHLFAIYRLQYILASACFMSLVLGLINHATYHPVINKLDTAFNCICVSYFSIKYYDNNHIFHMSMLCALISAYTFIKYSYTMNGIIMHSLIHIIGNIGIMLMIESNYRMRLH